MASCSLRTADFKVLKLDISRGRVSTLPPCSLRNWIGRTPHRYSSLVISHSSQNALYVCCSASPETRTITRSETGSEEIKPSSLVSQLIPNLHEVETLLTNICETSSIAEFELKLSGFNLRMTRSIKSENLPLPPVPAAASVIQNTSSIQSDSNGSVKTTSLALFKPEPISSPEGISRFVEKATDEGLSILPSPKVGFFRRSRTIKGKRAPPSCKENQVVKEGQVLCYIDQLGAEIPIESDISGEVVKILRKDGEPVGYGDALIAVLPSFPGIKKLQ
ncbi:biotin carboxyl carrier protein of acetyl-CoA carboxylase [Benincasa hispida]|uniref:biotin carboxyl carrier protein of acetyl-CoA carboxylase n=1 Tax=Benincasa hispida TaxID=102211 RepID=UPI0019008A07|nr:biotin carboxyl carrier protein of acetyl-CoA carboxylase [Benincasa hispida]